MQRLVVRTVPVADPVDLLSRLPRPTALAWVRDGQGIVGWGEAARIDLAGPGRFERAELAWHRLAERIDVDDEVNLPGSGLIAFAGFAFGADPGHSVLVVPRVIVGRLGDRSWITRIGGSDREPLDTVAPIGDPGRIHWREGRLPAHRWREAVTEAVRRMRSGSPRKVVLARDLLAEAAEPLDPRLLLRRLSARHPDCWTFAVDNLVGATPELLVRRHHDQVSSRVLAGTTWPGADEHLLSSATHHEEHRLAAESLTSSLRPHCSSLQTDGPFPLRLRNITHLSTDVVGRLAGPPATLLRLAGAVHPTAAVGGAPRAEAVRMIAELEGREGMDRGRYAGPVGWVDARGNGELGIALRCAQVSGRRARLFAGCGLVADSDPDLEMRETHAKFAAMRTALAG
jgi:menaquinone-specific isochorismate synthase